MLEIGQAAIYNTIGSRFKVKANKSDINKQANKQVNRQEKEKIKLTCTKQSIY